MNGETLTGGGDCFEHYHSEDRIPTHDTLSRLQQLARQNTVSTAYSLTKNDDYVSVTGTTTVTLPQAMNGQEFVIINSGTGTVTVNSFTGDTICGSTSVLLTVQWMALQFKAVSGGWIIV
jgi:hypothetical protein